jgi:Gram-negative bacterial TonB protein C-terminal/Tetratricopeptide repeat
MRNVKIQYKKHLFFISFLFISIASSAQNDEKYVYNSWIKSEILRSDSSRILDPTILNNNMEIVFKNNDSLLFKIKSRSAFYKYSIVGNSMIFGSYAFEVIEYSDTKLTLVDRSEPDRSKALMLKFIPKRLNDLTFSPEYYKAKNGENVYKSIPGLLEPIFLNANLSPIDFVFEKFGFPEYKKGGFVVRFIVNKDGQIKGTKLIASSNERYNDKLIQAVSKTKGKWLPGTFQGEKVNIEIEYNYNLGFEDRQLTSVVDSIAYAETYYTTGNDFFQTGSYRQAEKYYQKAIDFNPLHINAYYQHAATSIALRKKDEACKDYQQLIYLDQKKAKRLSDKYCK